MKTLQTLLRDADPVGYEPHRSANERLMHRRAILASTLEETDSLPRRSLAVIALAALIFIGFAAGARHWSGVVADVVAAVRLEVRLAEENPATGLREAVVAGTGRTIYLHEEVVVTNSDIANARAIPGDAGSTFSVSIVFTAEGAAKILRATRSHIDRPLAFLIDGEVVIAPVVRGSTSTAAIIDGNFTETEAERIAAGILGR
jgi:hypothetical protein